MLHMQICYRIVVKSARIFAADFSSLIVLLIVIKCGFTYFAFIMLSADGVDPFKKEVKNRGTFSFCDVGTKWVCDRSLAIVRVPETAH